MNEFLAIIHYSAPVALAALGETVGQKSGVLQIGIEGIMLTSAYTAFAVAASSGNTWLGVLSAIMVGLLMALGSAWFTIVLCADQIVVGTAFNLFALGITGALYRKQFAATGTVPVIHRIGTPGSLDPVLIFIFLLAALGFWAYRKTSWGLASRAAGEVPQAVEANGFRVDRLRLLSVSIGGMLTGLAGAYLSVGIVGGFSEGMTSGRGFVAIAMVTFGRWNMLGVVAASLLIGLAERLQYTLQAQGVSIPYQLLLAFPYVLALIVLMVLGKSGSGPASLGIPFRRDK